MLKSTESSNFLKMHAVDNLSGLKVGNNSLMLQGMLSLPVNFLALW